MKLSRNKMLLVSFMLFSLFFGAGNLIFPPFLGQNAGSHTLSAMLGFLATAVVPVSYTHLDVYKRQHPVLRVMIPDTKRECVPDGTHSLFRQPAG